MNNEATYLLVGIALLVGVGIFRRGKRLIGILFNIFVVVILFPIMSIIQNYDIKSPAEFVDTLGYIFDDGDSKYSDHPDLDLYVYQRSHNPIRTMLYDYTINANSGPLNNYYWKSGDAKIQDNNLSPGEIYYSEDEQGRAGIAMAKLTRQMWEDSAGSRQGKPLDPPFWPKNEKVSIRYKLTRKTYNGYLYNRSHSIADSLGGEATYTSKNNFTTGTRAQNVGADHKGGMRAAEIIVENYWKDNPNSKEVVDYQVTPVYRDEDELIPRGSVVDILSSDGVLNQRLVIINAVEGYVINYHDGTFTERKLDFKIYY